MVNVIIELAYVRFQTKACSFLVTHKRTAHIKHTLVYATPFDASVSIFDK